MTAMASSSIRPLTPGTIGAVHVLAVPEYYFVHVHGVGMASG